MEQKGAYLKAATRLQIQAKQQVEEESAGTFDIILPHLRSQAVEHRYLYLVECNHKVEIRFTV